MNKNELILIRDYMIEDRNFILATFLRGLFHGDSWFSIIDKKVFMKHYHKVIEFILGKPTTKVLVACLKEDPSAILGYSIFENDKIHWVYVKPAWRKIGLAKDLVPKNASSVTHLTKMGLSIIKNHKIEFNPFDL